MFERWIGINFKHKILEMVELQLYLLKETLFNVIHIF